MTMLFRVADRVLNRPLLIHPDKLAIILAVLEGRIPIDSVDPDLSKMSNEEREGLMTPSASRFDGSVYYTDTKGEKALLPYRRTESGIANISVLGSLVNRGAWVGTYSGLTSYEGLQYQLRHAAGDPNTRSVLLDISSPGGEAVGAFEVAALVREVAKVKPVPALVNGMAASAAYALASGADRIVTTESGISGSIGVVMMHADYSKFLEIKGVKPTMIFAGKHKVDGNMFEPLSKDVRSDLQAEVDHFYDLFVATVEQGRKSLSAQQIRDTEARTYIGAEAVKAGLADEVGTFVGVLEDMSRGGRPIKPGGRKMNDATATAEAASDNTATTVAAKQEGVREGAAQMQQRISAILTSDAAKGRESLANHFAFKTSMSAEDAIAALEAAPKAGAEAKTGIEVLAEAAPSLTVGAAPIGKREVSGDKSAALDRMWGKAIKQINGTA